MTHEQCLEREHRLQVARRLIAALIEKALLYEAAEAGEDKPHQNIVYASAEVSRPDRIGVTPQM